MSNKPRVMQLMWRHLTDDMWVLDVRDNHYSIDKKDGYYEISGAYWSGVKTSQSFQLPEKPTTLDEAFFIVETYYYEGNWPPRVKE